MLVCFLQSLDVNLLKPVVGLTEGHRFEDTRDHDEPYRLGTILKVVVSRRVVEKPGFPRGVGLKLLALCGVISPILLFILGGLAAQLRPGYNSVTQFGSELGVGSDAAATVAHTGFVVGGLLTVLFALGLWLGLGQGSRIGPALVGLFGLGLALSAVFPCDPGCPLPGQGVSIAQSIHWTLFTVGAFSLILGPLFIRKRLENDNRWKNYREYTLATSMVLLVLFVVFFSGVIFSSFLAPWRGTVEAVSFIPFYIWTVVIALRLLRLTEHATIT